MRVYKANKSPLPCFVFHILIKVILVLFLLWPALRARFNSFMCVY